MNERGMTLIEIVISTALLSSALVMAASVYASTTKIQLKGASLRSVQQSSRFILDQIARDIRNSAVITSTGTDHLRLANSQDVGGAVEYRYVVTAGKGKIQRCPYNASGSPLGCGDIGDTNIYVTAASFDYHGSTPGKTPYVKIDMTVQYDPALVSTDAAAFTYNISTIVASRDK